MQLINSAAKSHESVRGSVRQAIPKKTLNLTFHGLGVPPFMVNTAERNVWLDQHSFQGILDFIKHRPEIHITFDDGNASDFHIALPELLKRELKAEFFVVAGRLNLPGYLGIYELRELEQNGMTIGSHGMHHCAWSTLSNADLQEELCRAKTILQECLGHTVTAAACPFGSYNRRVLHQLKTMGYDRVLTSDRGWTLSESWLQPRNTLHAGDGPDTVRQLLSQSVSGISSFARQIKLILKRNR